jgi:hypothetical protein
MVGAAVPGARSGAGLVVLARGRVSARRAVQRPRVGLVRACQQAGVTNTSAVKFFKFRASLARRAIFKRSATMSNTSSTHRPQLDETLNVQHPTGAKRLKLIQAREHLQLFRRELRARHMATFPIRT